MVGEEQTLIGPWIGILNSALPILEIIFVLGICGLLVFIVWKRQPFKPWGARVLVKHRRGTDFTPELTDGRREKNKDTQQWGYKLRNGDWIPAQMFKNLRQMGKKAFLEVWEDESGKYIPAPSPFDTETEIELCPNCGKQVTDSKCEKCGEIKSLKTKIMTGVKNNPDEFSQADTNWLIEQFRNDVQMFTKKSLLKEWLPILVPAITIIVVVLGLVLYQTQVLGPLTNQANQVAQSNAHSAEVWMNVTNAWAAAQQCNGQAVATPTGTPVG